MSLDMATIEELTSIFQELADVGGNMERTKIFPNLEVIDATPTDLPVDYVIIQDDEGYYIPALKVPGIAYSDGDLVNVLFIKGTEPIAFQQGPASPSSPSASVTVRLNSGANVGTRPRLNFIDGTGITFTIVDDAGSNEVDITVDGAASAAADMIEIRSFN